jgi:hypothetical protein
VLKFSLVPIAFCNLSLNFDVNCGSRFDTMETGTPCSLTISCTYIFASLSSESVILMGEEVGTLRESVNNDLYGILSA